MSQASPWRIEIATARGDRTVMGLTQATGVSFENYIGKNGTMSCSVPIPSAAIARRVAPIIRDDVALTLTGYVYRGNEIWWGGRLGDPELKLSRAGDSVSLTGLSFESYLDDRSQLLGLNYVGVEQVELARTIWSLAMAGAGNLGITIPAATASGVLRDLVVAAADMRTLRSLINEIANQLDGFEWMINCYFDGTSRRRDLTFGYPAINRGDPGVLSYPGAIRSFSRKASTARTGTRFWNFGAAPDDVGSEAQLPIMSPVLTATDLIDNAAVLIDRPQSFSDIADQTDINRRNELALERYGRPLPIISATVDVGKISPRILGSTQTVRVSHDVYPGGLNGAPGYSEQHRVIGMKVKPDERGQSEEAELIFEEVG